MKKPGGKTELPDPQQLGRLADELADLAQSLAGISQPFLLNNGDRAADGPILAPDASDLLRTCRRIYEQRRARKEFFDSASLFGEPAWDILLDLFAADLDGRDLSVTDACIGAAVPMTTALRWTLILERQGLVRREGDPRDARRVFLRLSPHGRQVMTAYFERILSNES